ncbi:MAG TPA: hypothetical protein VFZ99_08465 [Terriglobales bacterium]
MRKVFPIFTALLGCVLWMSAQSPAPAGSSGSQSSAHKFSPTAQRMQQKLDFIEKNAQTNPVSTRPTQLKEDEANAWIAEGGLKLPTGVQQVVFHGDPGALRADARVDFDAITANKRSYNPLLALFSGTHDITVNANADAEAGTGHVHVQSVSLDGVDIPRMALQLFIDRYLKPKYPDVGMDTDFKMPSRIDTATVGNHYVVLTQK